MGVEQGPQMPSLEKKEGGIEKLRELRENLQKVKQVIDSQIDELVQKLSFVITSTEESSIKEGKSDEVIKEILESQKIMEEVGELREATRRLQSFIDQLDSSR